MPEGLPKLPRLFENADANGPDGTKGDADARSADPANADVDEGVANGFFTVGGFFAGGA